MPPVKAENATNSCRPRKYHGALAGFSGTLGLASSFSGASEMSDSATQTSVVSISTPNSA